MESAPPRTHFLGLHGSQGLSEETGWNLSVSIHKEKAFASGLSGTGITGAGYLIYRLEDDVGTSRASHGSSSVARIVVDDDNFSRDFGHFLHALAQTANGIGKQNLFIIGRNNDRILKHAAEGTSRVFDEDWQAP